MSEEEKTEQGVEETAPETAEAEEAAPEAAEPEASAPEAAATEPEEAPRAAADQATKAPKAEDAEPAEQLGPKERRRQARSTHSGEAGPARTVEQRIADRAEERKKKAASRSRYRAKIKAKKGEPGTGTPPATHEPGSKRVLQGIVTSSKADKTITVAIQSARRHPSYEKIIRRSKGLHAHDEANEAGEGDTVRVIETRPMSKSKRWRLIEVVEKAK